MKIKIKMRIFVDETFDVALVDVGPDDEDNFYDDDN